MELNYIGSGKIFFKAKSMIVIYILMKNKEEY